MTRLTGLADHLRKWGFTVVELPGWKTRGADFDGMPKVCVCHHTGTPRSKTKDLPTQGVLTNGRSDLDGPLCQIGYGYSGTVYMVAAGKANHAGKGHWAGVFVGNDDSVGIEAESPGDGTWTDAQREGYPRLAAAVVDYLNTNASHICAHRESAEPHGRKNDPVGIDMNDLRRKAAAHLKNGPATVEAHATVDPTPIHQETCMRILNAYPDFPPVVLRCDESISQVTNAERAAYIAAGVPEVKLTKAQFKAISDRAHKLAA